MAVMPASDPSPRKLTYEDYCALPDDGRRHEIVDGVHLVSPSPLDRHQEVSLNLTLLLGRYLRETRTGVLRVAPADVLLGPHDIVQPDLYVLLASSSERLERRGCQGPPDLVIEILSPGNVGHDLVKKLPRYEALGVSEFWAVDTELERVEVHRREGDRFARPILLEASREDVLTTPLLEGFDAPLAEVFFRDASALDGDTD